MSGALQLYRLFSPEAVDWPLPLDSVTLCYFFSQLDVDSVPQLLTQGALQLAAHPTTSLLGIYVGPEQEAGFEWVEEAATVLWIGPEGLGSEVSIRLGVEGTPQLVVIVGDQATQRLSTFPQDLLPLLPSQVLPAEVTETFTYVSLAEHLQGQDTTQVTDAYQDIARANSQMSLREISTLITALSERYQVDLSEGIQWFSAPRYGSADFEDLIDVSNITEGMFKQRLKNFCIYKSNAQLNESQPAEVYTGNYEELRALLSIFVGFTGSTGKKEPAKVDTRDAEIVNLTRSVSEKEQIIEQLKRELAERNTELAVLQAELEERIVPIVREPTPQSSFSIPTAESAPAAIQTESLALPRDEFDFWKFGQEEERNPSNAPKFEEIAAAKGLWILTAESQGLGPSIKDLRMRKQQAKTRKGTLPPLQHAPAGPERHAAGKKTKPVEKGLGSAGKLVPGKG